ncbi:hypothetical protein [Sinorhizobium meliloti]|uniref:hypothetical protein n=1 Tax=Rhizobium meliloti TaxID=382 RepID=UPI001296AFAC|nr:hypothetical protein [Sinorhizobium meliloti]MDX1247574.1 hypothetical protein [Sinorhizobium medicae]MQV80668.1 hypothetical protein [Sinorhizobium meliloti]
MNEPFSYDVEGAIFIRFAMVGRPVLNGLAAKGQRRRRDPYSATLFARDIVQSLRRQIGFRRQGEPVDDAAAEEFLATVIWDIPVEDFVVLVGIDATRRDAVKRDISKRLAERLTAEYEIFPDPAFYHGQTGTGPLGPSK